MYNFGEPAKAFNQGQNPVIVNIPNREPSNINTETEEEEDGE